MRLVWTVVIVNARNHFVDSWVESRRILICFVNFLDFFFIKDITLKFWLLALLCFFYTWYHFDVKFEEAIINIILLSPSFCWLDLSGLPLSDSTISPEYNATSTVSKELWMIALLFGGWEKGCGEIIQGWLSRKSTWWGALFCRRGPIQRYWGVQVWMRRARTGNKVRNCWW